MNYTKLPLRLFDAAISMIFTLIFISSSASSLQVSPANAGGLSSEFAIVGAIPSMVASVSKEAAVQKIADGGYGWMRHEFVERDPFDFGPYDAANSYAKARGIKTLGLLLFHPRDGSKHEQWKKFVTTVASHYGSDIAAWEILNEQDNFISAADYVPYLKEAREIIKQYNPNATIVLGGLTSRPEAPTFWNGVKDAGGWGDFDVLGLHVYHEGSPEKVNFGGGDLVAELERTVASINKNGGGKKIWITEMGYKPDEVGEENQANWLARTLIMSRSVSQVEKIFTYRLYDSADSPYGITTIGLTERPAFDAVKSVIDSISGQGIGKRLYPQQKTTIDTLDSSSGWKAFGQNASASVETVAGKTGSAVKLSYHFTADGAHALMDKTFPINGTPEALAFWVNGDNSRNILKFRFIDSKGETFQADFGVVASGWSYKQFRINQDSAMISWGGDSKVDYPIKFNSFVMDRQGGDANGHVSIDHLVAITGGADLFAYQFGSTIAYWKVQGTGEADLCGAKREFTEMVNYVKNANCDDTPKVNPVKVIINQPESKPAPPVAAPTSAPTTAPTTAPKAVSEPKPASTPIPKPVVDKEKSIIRVDGEGKLANSKDTYRVVVTIKDTTGAVLKDRKPSIVAGDGMTGLAIGEVTLVGDEWWIDVSSTEVGEKTIRATVEGQELRQTSLAYISVPILSPSPTPVAQEEVANSRESKAKIALLTVNIFLGLSLLGLLIRHVLIARR